MKKLVAAAATLLLAGCASMPMPSRVQIGRHSAHKPAVTSAQASVPAVNPQKPATFKERFQSFRHKHPIRWFH